MRKIFVAAFLLTLLTAPVCSQDNKSPFYLFDRQVKGQPGSWAGSKQDLSTVFNVERIRLGDRFEVELIKYLDNDIDKHYWISSFLESPSYLHGNKPLPYLSLLIKQQGLSLLRGKTDRKSVGNIVRLSVTAAVLSKDLGLHALGETYKSDAENILVSDSGYRTSFPGMRAYHRCIYDSIGANREALCRKDEAEGNNPRVQRRVSGGVLNGRAISKPTPVYPEEAKAQGVTGIVTVQILIDEEGKVESAHGVSGHPLLQEAAVIAAHQARFSPLRLSGQLVKVSGTLTYNFVLNE